MNPPYKDITTRINQTPMWYTKNGVPRYNAFDVDDISNIYAQDALLLEIQCQVCERRFQVEVLCGRQEASIVEHLQFQIKGKRTSLQVLIDSLDWGDPPFHGCIGDSMTTYTTAILQVWKREFGNWKRMEELEGRRTM